MALRGIQEYIARDVNNIRAIQYYYYYSYRALCVILRFYDHEWLPAAILSVYKQAEKSACGVRACVEWSSSATHDKS